MKKILLLLFCVFYFFGMGIGQDKIENDTITTKSGLKYIKVKKGTGVVVAKEKEIFTHIVLTNLKGKKIWTTREKSERSGKVETFDFIYGKTALIKGFNEGVGLMRKGDRFTFILPPNIAYGEKGQGADIPPNTTLVFDIEIIDVKEFVR